MGEYDIKISIAWVDLDLIRVHQSRFEISVSSKCESFLDQLKLALQEHPVLLESYKSLHPEEYWVELIHSVGSRCTSLATSEWLLCHSGSTLPRLLTTTPCSRYRVPEIGFESLLSYVAATEAHCALIGW